MFRSRVDLPVAGRASSASNAGERRSELVDVGLIHAVHPVEPACVVGRDARKQRGGQAATGEQRRAGEGMRPATRPAERAELVDAELVEQRRDVLDDIADTPAGPLGRATVAGTRVADEPESQKRSQLP